MERVVEDGIGDEAARIVRLVCHGIKAQRITITAADAVVAAEVARKLRLVKRLDVSSMVLVKVGEAVVQKDVRAHVVRNQELQLANVGGELGGSGPAAVSDDGRVSRPFGSFTLGRAVLEIARDMTGRDGAEERILWRVGDTVLVLDGQLLHLYEHMSDAFLVDKRDPVATTPAACRQQNEPEHSPTVAHLLWVRI